VRLGIRARFLLAASVLVPAVLALAWTATRGLDQLDSRVDQLYAKNVVTGERAQAVGTALDRVDRTSIAALASHDAAERRRLASAIAGTDGPAVDAALVDLAHAPGIDSAAERTAAAHLTLAWSAFRQRWLGWRLESPRTSHRCRLDSAIPARLCQGVHALGSPRALRGESGGRVGERGQ